MSLDDWDAIRPDRRARAIGAGMGLLRVTLLFGSAIVALALLAVPVLDNYNDRQEIARGGLIGVDTTMTGSISRSNTYTIRRSVLQSSPDSVCVIRANRHSGDC